MLMSRGIPPEYSTIRSTAGSENNPRSREPAMRSRVRMYVRASAAVSGAIWERSPTRCLSCCSSGIRSLALSSGWPTSTICSSLLVGVSKFESNRTCSSVEASRFWASSRISTVFWPARSRSTRKLFSAMSCWARDSPALGTPRSCSAYSRMPSNGRVELNTNATAVCPLSRCRSACTSVVFPVPTWPVRTMKPFRSWTPYRSWASASRWPGLMYRNLGSGVGLKGFSVRP